MRPFEIRSDHSHGWLTLEESARLLQAIFPAYPLLTPCCKAPPRNEWFRHNRFGGAAPGWPAVAGSMVASEAYRNRKTAFAPIREPVQEVGP
jgi:hypothetical protein